jgi:hypothetical protein
MTNDDFFEFVSELDACFPMIAKWFLAQGDSVANKWREMVAPVGLADAKNLLNEWLRTGSHPFRDANQWQEIPGMIRREAMNRNAKQQTPDWKKPAYRPSEDSEFVKFSKRMHEVAARYDNGIGSITLEEAKAEHRAILAEYDAHVASKRHKEFANA